MSTQTPVYSFELPTPGADDDIWGGYLNGNWSALDPILADFETRIAAEEAETAVPIGTITLWYGALVDIPAGWGWCDGSEDTRTDAGGQITSPNLKNLFVVGADSDAGGTNPVGNTNDYDGSGGGANFRALAYIMKI